MKKATRSEKQGSQSQGQNSTDTIDRIPSKIARVLIYLRYVGPLNTFEAERIGDHCLPSTISTLANSYNITLTRKREKVPNNWGAPCFVTRYSLPESEHERAKAVINFMRGKGDAL